jgi:hypothetical protein
VYLARISGTTGLKLREDIQVTTSPTGSATTAVWWTGSRYGVAWTEDVGGGVLEGWMAEVCP